MRFSVDARIQHEELTEMPEYSNVPELAYDWMIVTYFFLGGLSAGSFLFSVATTYWKQEFQPLGRRPAILAPIILAVGMLILLIDLGQPFRAWRLFVSLNPTSALSWGVWFLNAFFIFSMLYAWGLVKSGPEKARKFGYLGVPFAVLVAAYTGVLLAQAPDRPLWHAALIPVLFLNGALVSGMALGLLVSTGQQDGGASAKIGKFLACLVLLELGLVVVELIVLFNGGAEGTIAVRGLLTGPYTVAFLGIEVLAGMIVPAVLLLRSKALAAQVVASALILVGVFTMRYVVVIGGQVFSG